MASTESGIVGSTLSFNPTISCNNCGVEHQGGEKPLAKCSRCKATHYCSRSCQKEDWKKHKTTCVSPEGQQSAQPSSSANNQSAKAMMERMMGLDTKSTLHGKPEPEVFKLLIDAYRMRCQDESAYSLSMPKNSLYDGGDPSVGFKDFLNKVQVQGGVLPSWWSQAKADACVARGNEKVRWARLDKTVSKAGIQEHYGDNMAPMKLRLLAEEIIGTNVMKI